MLTAMVYNMNTQVSNKLTKHFLFCVFILDEVDGCFWKGFMTRFRSCKVYIHRLFVYQTHI